jgi:hypothetical protein
LRTSVPPLVNSFNTRQTILSRGIAAHHAVRGVHEPGACTEDRARTRRQPVGASSRLQAEPTGEAVAGAVASIVKAASVAFQPLVPDWKLPFGSRLFESARARGDNGSESTANTTTAAAVFRSSRALLTFGRCVVASYHKQKSPSD